MPCRDWWRNCAIHPDDEIEAIDRLEDTLCPLPDSAARIRALISCLELCHHKAERWIDNLIEAIRAGETGKGLGTRPPAQHHSVEDVWQNACASLSAWCAGCPARSLLGSIGSVSVSQALAALGERTPLKEWQVQRVVEKIRGLIHWPQSSCDPSAQYIWLLFQGGELDEMYRTDCPIEYREHQDFWHETTVTMIHDHENGDEAALSLGLAIDMLWPCHWNFVENLQLVLSAIGGNLHPDRPFMACGRNIACLPNRARFESVADTLQEYAGVSGRHGGSDAGILARLGELTPIKQWLAESLAKTIRLQLEPPAELRAISALTGPAWIARRAES